MAHWRRVGADAVDRLHLLGSRGRRLPARQPHGAASTGAPAGAWRRGGFGPAAAGGAAAAAKTAAPAEAAAPSAAETARLATLKPLLICVKTAMVKACDGSGVDLDGFTACWRLLLALTDPAAAGSTSGLGLSGLAFRDAAKRRATVERQINDFLKTEVSCHIKKKVIFHLQDNANGNVLMQFPPNFCSSVAEWV